MTQALYAHMNNKTIKKGLSFPVSRLNFIFMSKIMTNIAVFDYILLILYIIGKKKCYYYYIYKF
jgi:ABC-type transport system involved in multi-copper enzyme maturation permease subunit